MMKHVRAIVVLLALAFIAPMPLSAQDADQGAATQPPKATESDAPAESGAAEAADADESAGDTESGGRTDPDAPSAAEGSDSDSGKTTSRSFAEASKSWERKLEAKTKELTDLRERITEEKLPLMRKLRALERKQAELEQTFQAKSRQLDTRTLGVSNLKNEIEAREEELNYIKTSLLGDYVRNVESRLHIAEVQRYADVIEAARLAPDNSKLAEKEVVERQLAVVGASFTRLAEVAGGARFAGRAVSEGDGEVKEGRYFLMGPAALFRSDDGELVGTAVEALNANDPIVRRFVNPEDAAAAAALVAGEAGAFPLDPTGGKAFEVQETKQTLWEHIQQGGPVMVPIFALAGISLLVAIYKWLALTLVRRPSQGRVRELLGAISEGDEASARSRAGNMKGPIGTMLQSGVEHLRYPRELIEEVMYEKVLATRLKLQRFLPFIAITAAAAPLLGLLGTVTGIIETFGVLQMEGGGSNMQALSRGISEALVTTEFGLIVAIPSLLLHAFLYRKARGISNQMEQSAVALANAVSKSPFAADEAEPQAAAAPSPHIQVTADMKQAMEGLEDRLTGDDRHAIGAALERLNHSAVALLRAAYSATPSAGDRAEAEGNGSAAPEAGASDDDPQDVQPEPEPANT